MMNSPAAASSVAGPWASDGPRDRRFAAGLGLAGFAEGAEPLTPLDLTPERMSVAPPHDFGSRPASWWVSPSAAAAQSGGGGGEKAVSQAALRGGGSGAGCLQHEDLIARARAAERETASAIERSKANRMPSSERVTVGRGERSPQEVASAEPWHDTSRFRGVGGDFSRLGAAAVEPWHDNYRMSGYGGDHSRRDFAAAVPWHESSRFHDHSRREAAAAEPRHESSRFRGVGGDFSRREPVAAEPWHETSGYRGGGGAYSRREATAAEPWHESSRYRGVSGDRSSTTEPFHENARLTGVGHSVGYNGIHHIGSSGALNGVGAARGHTMASRQSSTSNLSSCNQLRRSWDEDLAGAPNTESALHRSSLETHPDLHWGAAAANAPGRSPSPQPYADIGFDSASRRSRPQRPQWPTLSPRPGAYPPSPALAPRAASGASNPQVLLGAPLSWRESRPSGHESSARCGASYEGGGSDGYR